MKAGELRELAINWLRTTYPNSLIVTELSVADWDAASIDVAAITENHIVGICGGRAALVEPLTEAVCAGLPVTIIHDEMIRALRWRKPVLDLRRQEPEPTESVKRRSRKTPARTLPELDLTGTP